MPNYEVRWNFELLELLLLFDFSFLKDIMEEQKCFLLFGLRYSHLWSCFPDHICALLAGINIMAEVDVPGHAESW